MSQEQIRGKKISPRKAAPGSMWRFCPVSYWLLLLPIPIHEGFASYWLLAISSSSFLHCFGLIISWATRHVVFSIQSLAPLAGAELFVSGALVVETWIRRTSRINCMQRATPSVDLSEGPGQRTLLLYNKCSTSYLPSGLHQVKIPCLYFYTWPILCSLYNPYINVI